MNREEYFNSDISRLDFARTRFDMPYQYRTAFNTGDIVPIMAEPILPGDTVDCNLSYLVRLFTPLNQFFSNCFLDTIAMFVPHRLVWTHWAQFCGENDVSAWTNDDDSYTVPQTTWTIAASTSGDFGTEIYMKSLGCYLGINFTTATQGTGGVVNTYSVAVSDLFRRGYLECWNQWFRDENLQDPILYSRDDIPEVGASYTYSSQLLKAAKFHDYFTSLVPDAQKGAAVPIGGTMGTGLVNDDTNFVQGPVIPVVALGSSHGVSAYPVNFKGFNTASVTAGSYPLFGTNSSTGGDFKLQKGSTKDSSSADTRIITPDNLYAQMTITIEDLRRSIALQHLTEKLATSGSRYPEFLKGVWGVTSSDARLQIPEYLGGKRFPIHISEVVSTADTVGSETGAPIGTTGAMVKDGNAGHLFTKAFTEYGTLWVFAVVRIEQSYFQGLNRKFTDKEFGDFYNPYVAHIGNQPRLKKEIYSLGTGETVFGFGPAWDHLRYQPYIVTSIMRPDLNAGLSSWDASEVFASAPVLNDSFVKQAASGLDRCLAIPSESRYGRQWFGEFKFHNTWVRVLPAFSTPGLSRI